MPFPSPPVESITLPDGATSGARIVLDGTTDTITGYNADDTIAWQLQGGAALHADTASNLAGGGSAQGVTTIAGAFIIGNPAGAHVIIGTDGNGADGVRIYGLDGSTVLIDLTIAGTPTISSTDIVGALITGSTLETSSNPADARVVIDATGLRAYDDSGSGIPVFSIDTSSGLTISSVGELDLGDGAALGPVAGIFHAGHGVDHQMSLRGPMNGIGQQPAIEMHSGTDDGVWPQALYLDATEVASDRAPSLVALDASLNPNTLSVRRLGNLVHFSGYVQMVSGSFATGANITVAAAGGLDGNYRPGRAVIAAAAHTFGGGAHVSTCRVTVNADGSIVINNIQQTSVTTVWLDGVSYWI